MTAKRHRVLAICVMMLMAAAPAIGQLPMSGFSVETGMSMPIAGDERFFGSGVHAQLVLFRRLAFSPFLMPSLGVSYAFVPVEFDTSISIPGGGGGVGVVLANSPMFQFVVAGSGGYFYGFFNDDNGTTSGGGYVEGQAVASLSLGPGFTLSLGGGYRNYLGLAQFIVINLGGRISLDPPETEVVPQPIQAAPQPLIGAPRPMEDAAGAELLRIEDPEFAEIFPVFFKYYDEHPLGSARLRNHSDLPITDLTMSLGVGRYMDSATPCRVPSRLGARETAEIDILGFFNDTVLEITEATKVAADLTVSFTHDGRQYTNTYTDTLRLHDRNSMTWDDDQKAAAYVTARDPAVMSLGRLVSGVVAGDSPNPIPRALRTAMALHTAVSEYGMIYTPDPSSPYRNRDGEQMQVDYLQFPRQTLEYKGGDCDDLSILYNALFESLGISSAFIFTPGHVFVALDTGLDWADALRQFPRADDLILHSSSAWIPFEITALSDGFLEAWRTGAQQWREADIREQSEFHVTADCWQTYEPVGLMGQSQPLMLPEADAIAAVYRRELTTFIDQMIFQTVAELEARAQRQSDPTPTRNRLAALYGRYGLVERALAELAQILEHRPDYVPALVNMGNIHFLSGDHETAYDFFHEALDHDPENPLIMLSVAQASHRLGNMGTATRMLNRAKELDPALAARFAYIETDVSQGTRAGDRAGQNEIILWAEDEE